MEVGALSFTGAERSTAQHYRIVVFGGLRRGTEVLLCAGPDERLTLEDAAALFYDIKTVYIEVLQCVHGS
jgi:hypothetical protein